MKKVLTIATAIIMVMSMMLLAGCGSDSEDNAEKPEVTVLAAASLTDALDEIIAEYEKDAECTITPSYAGSGDLVQQAALLATSSSRLPFPTWISLRKETT